MISPLPFQQYFAILLPVLSVGLSALLIILVVSIFKYFRSDSKIFFKQVLFRLIPAFVIAFFFYQTPTNKQVEFFYRDKPDFVELYNQFYEDPTNAELELNVRESLRSMNE